MYVYAIQKYENPWRYTSGEKTNFYLNPWAKVIVFHLIPIVLNPTYSQPGYLQIPDKALNLDKPRPPTRGLLWYTHASPCLWPRLLFSNPLFTSLPVSPCPPLSVCLSPPLSLNLSLSSSLSVSLSGGERREGEIRGRGLVGVSLPFLHLTSLYSNDLTAPYST